MENNTIPKVKAIAIYNHEFGIWDLYLTCPYCGQEHHHGGGNGKEPQYGARTSHCTGDHRPGLQEYELIPGDIIF